MPPWYLLDRFRIDTRTNRLFDGDRLLDVTPKAVALLVFLISERHRVVDKQELMERLWPDRFVAEANLTQHVFTLRRALGESAHAPRFIATVARHGYRFVGTLKSVNHASEAAPVAARPMRRIAWISVAVLGSACVLLTAAGVWWNVRRSAREAADASARQLYLRGRYYWSQGYDNPANLQLSLACFSRAISQNPRFGPAYAGLAMTHSAMAVRHLEPPDVAYARLKEAAEGALALDQDLPEAHYALGAAAFRHDWDLPRAERELRRALALDPAYSEAHKLYADFLTDVGRYDEAFREITRAQELDPLWGIHVRSYARTLAAAGRVDEAIAEYRRALSRDPDSYRLYLRLAELFERKGAYDDAVAMRERAEVLAASRAEPGDLACCQEDADILAKEYRQRGFQAAMRALFRRKLARLIEQSRERYVSPFTFALVYARLGDVDHVIEELERAVRDRTSELVAWRLYPELEPFSTDARLRRALADAGLFVQ